MILLSSILVIVLSPLSGKFSETLSNFWLSFLILVGIAVVAGLHILLRGLWVGTMLKVMLDITRYMGSPEYRATLLKAFDEEISHMRSRGEGHGFVLYAHSLGSVIALDSIVNSRVWQPDDEVQLITLGSPIARFFIRFFPGYLFRPRSEMPRTRLRAGWAAFPGSTFIGLGIMWEPILGSRPPTSAWKSAPASGPRLLRRIQTTGRMIESYISSRTA